MTNDESELPALEALTPGEEAVLALLADGHSNKAIAEHLSLREKTVKNRVSDILSKLGVDNRTQAATWFHKRSLADIQEKSKIQ